MIEPLQINITVEQAGRFEWWIMWQSGSEPARRYEGPYWFRRTAEHWAGYIRRGAERGRDIVYITAAMILRP